MNESLIIRREYSTVPPGLITEHIEEKEPYSKVVKVISSYGVGKLKSEKIGEKRGRLYVAINLLDVLDAAIAEKTGFFLEEIEKLRKNNKNQWGAFAFSDNKLKNEKMLLVT